MYVSEARKLVAEIKSGLAVLDNKIKNHEYISALEQGKIPHEALQGFAGHQYSIIKSDLRSFALQLNRHSSETGRRYLIGMITGESAAFEVV